MQIQINSAEQTKYGFYFDAVCNKTAATVHISAWGLQVCWKNAAHKVWRKGGKHFSSAEEALANYKSEEMRQIITAALEQNAQNVSDRIVESWKSVSIA